MKHPYPINNVNYDIKKPVYAKNNESILNSRYSIYRKIVNLDFPVLEIKLTNSISQNETYLGYYYTTNKNETLYQISKKFYSTERYWWIIAKANNLKNDGISYLDKNITLTIPAFSELQKTGGYFNAI